MVYKLDNRAISSDTAVKGNSARKDPVKIIKIMYLYSNASTWLDLWFISISLLSNIPSLQWYIKNFKIMSGDSRDRLIL